MQPESVRTVSAADGGPRLRILQVVASYYPAVRYGGPIRSVHGLAAALARRGHEVQVYTTNADGPFNLEVPLDRPVDIDGVQVHYFPVGTLRRLFRSPALGRRLRDTVHTFDIVHLQAVFLWPMWAAARAAERAQVPFVMSPRGMLVGDMIKRKSRWVKKAWIELVERHSLSRSAGVHVTAELEALELAALGLPVPAVAQIPNGVEFPDTYPPLEAGPFATLQRPYVLFLSRISWKKGLDRLITAWARVPDVDLVIAGNDDEEYLPTLQQLARSHGVAGRVRFIGPVSDTDKWALYENAALFVLPSYSENFGNVVAEAMAAGCPVIVSPEVGIAGLVRAGECGIVTACDPPDLAAAVNGLLADSDRRRELARRAKVIARERLSWAGVAEEMEGFYFRAMAHPAHRQAIPSAEPA